MSMNVGCTTASNELYPQLAASVPSLTRDVIANYGIDFEKRTYTIWTIYFVYTSNLGSISNNYGSNIFYPWIFFLELFPTFVNNFIRNWPDGRETLNTPSRFCFPPLTSALLCVIFKNFSFANCNLSYFWFLFLFFINETQNFKCLWLIINIFDTKKISDNFEKFLCKYVRIKFGAWLPRSLNRKFYFR